MNNFPPLITSSARYIFFDSGSFFNDSVSLIAQYKSSVTGTPFLSNSMVGLTKSARFIVPNISCASINPATVPGTAIAL